MKNESRYLDPKIIIFVHVWKIVCLKWFRFFILDFGETGVCGEEELENCEEMSRLRRSYPEPVIAGARKSYFNSTLMSMIIPIIFK